MLNYVNEIDLSLAVRDQVQLFLDSLGRELALGERPATNQAAADLLDCDRATKSQLAAALAELASRLPHDLFESGSERFAAELRRYSRLFDRFSATDGPPYFSYILWLVPMGYTMMKSLAFFRWVQICTHRRR